VNFFFIPRNNKIYSVLVTIPLYRLYASTLAVVGILFFVWWIFFYTPLTNNIASLQLDHAYLTQQESSCVPIRQDIQRLEGVTKELNATVASCLHEHSEHNDTTNILLAKILEVGLELISCVPGQPKDKEWYTVHPVELQISGTFDNLQRFLKSLALHDYPICIKHMVIKKQQNNKLLINCIFNVIGTPHDRKKTS
jgi:Tfp pilus assembly protein PilO